MIFHYDLEGKLLAETDGLGTVVKEYYLAWGRARGSGLAPVGHPTRAGVLHYADQLNTPRVTVSSSNTMLWRWDPEPFGSRLPNEDGDGNGKKLVINLRYPADVHLRKRNSLLI